MVPMWVDESNEPLFPFGFGLSYTQFAFSNLSVSVQQKRSDGALDIQVDVSNVGDIAGDEVVQLYTRTFNATVTRRVTVLHDFQRLSLAPGEQNASLSNSTFAKPPTTTAICDLWWNQVFLRSWEETLQPT